jgi:hypothetical protein
MKRKVNINRKEISSEEIAKQKNFDSVLKKLPAKFFLLKKPWFLSSVVVASIAIAVSLFFVNKNKNATQLSTTQSINNSDSLALEAFYKEEEKKPCIAPPIAGLNIPYTTYKVIAEKGGTLNFKTNSKITIPENAFIDKNGNLLKGEVELRYREFHDAADFFVSGIPMTYDSAGVRYQFESAGMMEILAYQNNEPVKMAPEKSINIELASNYKGTEYNLYKLDTIKNDWSCLGKDKIKKEDEKKLKAEKFSNRNDSVKYVSIQETPSYKKIETKKTEIQKTKETQIAALPKLAPEPKKPQQARKEKFTFNIDVDPQEYPELAVYKGLLFEVGNENKNFNTSMYDITWDEAVIKEGTKQGENYLLTLTKTTKKYDLIVYPVFEGKNFEIAMKVYQDKFKQHQLLFGKRKAEEKRIEDAYQAKLAALKKQQEAIEREWKMADANRFKTMTTQEKVYRMFTINSFGVFNCDNPSVYPQGVLCTANLKADKDRNLKCYQTFLVDKQKNGLFTYNRNPITTFSFNPASTNMLWTVEDGVLYWLKPEQFNAIKSGKGTSDLMMNRVEQKFDSVEELKAYFNF